MFYTKEVAILVGRGRRRGKSGGNFARGSGDRGNFEGGGSRGGKEAAISWREERATLVGGRSWQLWWVGGAGNFGGWEELATLVGGRSWQLW